MPYNSFDLITDYIYIGDENAVKNNAKEFSLIVNTSNAVKCPSTPECVFFPVANSEKDVQKYFNLIKSTGIIEKIRSFVLNKKKVLINCTQGMHRSCTMAACYYMKYDNMGVDQVMKFIKSKRRIAFNPVYRLKGVLDLYYKLVHPGEKQDIVKSPPKQQNIQKQTQRKPLDQPRKVHSCGCGN